MVLKRRLKSQQSINRFGMELEFKCMNYILKCLCTCIKKLIKESNVLDYVHFYYHNVHCSLS